MKKEEKEIMTTLKETIPFLNEVEKIKVLAFVQGMSYIATRRAEKDVS